MIWELVGGPEESLLQRQDVPHSVIVSTSIYLNPPFISSPQAPQIHRDIPVQGCVVPTHGWVGAFQSHFPHLSR